MLMCPEVCSGTSAGAVMLVLAVASHRPRGWWAPWGAEMAARGMPSGPAEGPATSAPLPSLRTLTRLGAAPSAKCSQSCKFVMNTDKIGSQRLPFGAAVRDNRGLVNVLEEQYAASLAIHLDVFRPKVFLASKTGVLPRGFGTRHAGDFSNRTLSAGSPACDFESHCALTAR